MFRWGEFTQNGGDICTKVWHSKVEKTSHGTMKVSTLGVNFQCEYFNIILGRIATDVGDKFTNSLLKPKHSDARIFCCSGVSC